MNLKPSMSITDAKTTLSFSMLHKLHHKKDYFINGLLFVNHIQKFHDFISTRVLIPDFFRACKIKRWISGLFTTRGNPVFFILVAPTLALCQFFSNIPCWIFCLASVYVQFLTGIKWINAVPIMAMLPINVVAQYWSSHMPNYCTSHTSPTCLEDDDFWLATERTTLLIGEWCQKAGGG